MIKKSLKKFFKIFFPDTVMIIEKTLRKELADCKSVLDLGCGPSSPLKNLKKTPAMEFYSVGVDVFEPYILRNVEREKIHSKYINADILSIDFPPKSFDCAILIDVIEHFEKKDFLNFLPKLNQIAKKIIIITPNGFIEQKSYDNNPYQIHKSGWTVNEMRKYGFECFGLSGLKYLRGQMWEPKIKPIVLGGVISDITQPLIKYMPKLAYHLICIKK